MTTEKKKNRILHKKIIRLKTNPFNNDKFIKIKVLNKVLLLIKSRLKYQLKILTYISGIVYPNNKYRFQVVCELLNICFNFRTRVLHCVNWKGARSSKNMSGIFFSNDSNLTRALSFKSLSVIRTSVRKKLRKICLLENRGSSSYYFFYFLASSILESDAVRKTYDRVLEEIKCFIFPFMRTKKFHFLLSVYRKFLKSDFTKLYKHIYMSIEHQRIKKIFSNPRNQSDLFVFVVTQIVTNTSVWYGNLEFSLLCLVLTTQYFVKRQNYIAVLAVWFFPAVSWFTLTIGFLCAGGWFAGVYTPEGIKKFITIAQSFGKFLDAILNLKDLKDSSLPEKTTPKEQKKLPNGFMLTSPIDDKKSKRGKPKKDSGSNASESSEEHSSGRALSTELNLNPLNIPKDKKKVREHIFFGVKKSLNHVQLAVLQILERVLESKATIKKSHGHEQ